MKRVISIILLCMPLLALLSGCDASLAADRHDVERLLLIQTLGLDSKGSGVEMSVSSGLGPEDDPALVMSTAAAGIEDAITRLQNYSPENQLFYAHVQYLLLGEEAAKRELQSVIEWVDRSPTLRMDTNMLIVRGAAKDAVVNASQQSTDITQRLTSLDRQAQSAGWTIRTLREVAAALAQGDGALALAVETVPTDDTVFTEDQQSDAVIPAGYAVLGEGGLVEFLSPEESLAAEILTGNPTGLLITVEGNTMEILDGSAKITGQTDKSGAPRGISVQCEIHTGVLEKSRDSALDPEQLNTALSETVSAWLYQVLERAQSTGCDFLGLKKAVLTDSAGMAAYGESWKTVFPTLPVSVSVEGQVDRSYDLAE